MNKPEEPTYEYGWKYGDRPNFGSDYEAALRLYVRDLEKYCDYLENKEY